ncbi:hypothetical protein GJV26_04355 [Massilia dura]|uniref:Glycoside hydrolase family 65 n=1 Tax=Pseudoduganella dura TaxID=321982 RepID=A0A6I3X4C6_9BURK|nr:hypothetical protein [Pseudoduganella dura]MUI11719.1 hypothetical protein [Pseudoduganella dura]GGX78566.1 hypothetical protein GCM10007386_06970 [Pseudoduganella dura]
MLKPHHLAGLPLLAVLIAANAAPIDRQAVVKRHDPHLRAIDPMSPLSVGNGRFAFTADVTGLQTLPDHYHGQGTPTETGARWSWHENPNPHGYKLSDANRDYTAWGRTVGYPMNAKSPAGQWLRENPHVHPLPQIGFVLTGTGARPLAAADVKDVDQRLDLWKGQLDSHVRLLGQPVSVSSAVSPDSDTLALRIRSPLLAGGRVAVRIALPYGYRPGDHHNPPLDWSQPDGHRTKVLEQTGRRLVVEHTRDASRYAMTLASGTPLTIAHPGAHVFEITPKSGETLELTISFVRDGIAPAPAAASVFKTGSAFWDRFWRSGAAIDFAGSTDPRAAELERRVVLSQYLAAIQLGDEMPASESGLTTSTWYGKHHTEMVWWHTAHFALWGRPEYTARTLTWFQRTLPVARAVAAERGLKGARWMKMTGPGGRESPGGNPLIVWNQPHPIHLAELLYRANPTRETLERYRELVFDTAQGMATMLHWDDKGKRYVLGPPLWIAQEIYDQGTSMNPTYELSYWARGLEIAQQWRERLGMPRDEDWERRRTGLSKLPVKDGKYVALESTPDTWDNVDSRHDHPSFLMALGQLPGDGVDRAIMRNTLDAVLAKWDWNTKIWGWDYPMIAMTAARLDAPELAVGVLLKSDGPNNGYTAAGHNPNKALPVYLPGNGALLAAVAMMAGGWDGAPRATPGFPDDGTWKVRTEGFMPLP